MVDDYSQQGYWLQGDIRDDEVKTRLFNIAKFIS